MHISRQRYIHLVFFLCCWVMAVFYALFGNWHLMLVLASFSAGVLVAVLSSSKAISLLFFLNGTVATVVCVLQLPERASFIYAEPSHLALVQSLIFFCLYRANSKYLAILNLIPLALSQSTSGLLSLLLLSIVSFDFRKRGLLFIFIGVIFVVTALSIEQVNARIVNLLEYVQGKEQAVNSASIRTSSFLAIYQFFGSPSLSLLFGYSDSYHEAVSNVYYRIISNTPHEDLYNSIAVLLYKDGLIGFVTSVIFMVSTIFMSRLKVGVSFFFYMCLVISFFSGYVVGPMAVLFYFLTLVVLTARPTAGLIGSGKLQT